MFQTIVPNLGYVIEDTKVEDDEVDVHSVDNEASDAVPDSDTVTDDLGSVSSRTCPPPFERADLETWQLLQMSTLNQWDYPIFDLANQAGDTILSRVRNFTNFTESNSAY